MPEPTIPVPLSTLHTLLRLAREGASPRIHWSASREKMDTAATQRRSEIFAEMEEELAPLLPHHPLLA